MHLKERLIFSKITVTSNPFLLRYECFGEFYIHLFKKNFISDYKHSTFSVENEKNLGSHK